MDARNNAVPGLFFTSLVKTQTNVETPGERKKRRAAERSDPQFDRVARAESFRRPPATSVEQRFRHSGWMIERLRVQTALLTASVPASRYERFCDCGSDCVVEFSPTANRHRTRANYCGDRFCLPCSRARAERVRRRVQKLIGDQTPLVMTLTVRNDPGSLTERLNHLLTSFRRLRQTVLWKNAVQAGAAFVEVKKGRNSGEWHPHLHVIAIGRFIPQEKLSHAWHTATGDSFVVDIGRARDAVEAGNYACKYATKGWTSEVVRDLDACVECVLSLRGRRLCLTFGRWVGIDVEDDGPIATDWKRVGRLDHVYSEFLRGELWAKAVMLSLMNGDEEKTNLPEMPADSS